LAAAFITIVYNLKALTSLSDTRLGSALVFNLIFFILTFAAIFHESLFLWDIVAFVSAFLFKPSLISPIFNKVINVYKLATKYIIKSNSNKMETRKRDIFTITDTRKEIISQMTDIHKDIMQIEKI